MQKPGLIQRFFILCAGPNREIIYQCPTEWNKYSGIGATIFFTGLLACLSGGYALFTIFRGVKNDLTYAVLFGMLWGFLIFNLDRFIVLSIKKQGNIKKELLHSIPRFILAIIIAVVISKPVEIKIFENRIAQQILEDKMKKMEEDKQLIESLNDLAVLDSSINSKNDELGDLDSLRSGDPSTPTFKRLISERNTASADFDRVSRANTVAIAGYTDRINSIRSDPENHRNIVDSNGRIIRTVLLDRARNQVNSLSASRNSLRSEIEAAEKKVRDLAEEIDKHRKDHQAFIARQIDDRQTQLDQVKQSKRRADSIAALQKIESVKVKEVSYTNNFITQLEALSNLTAANASMRWTSWMVMLLFIIVEISPVMVKILSARGPYDEMLHTAEVTIALEESRKSQELQANIDTLLESARKAAEISGRVYITVKEDELNAQVAQNKDILEKVAARQAQLVDIYIDAWFEEEKKKIQGNSYIHIQPKAVLEEVFWRQETPPGDVEYFFRNGQAQNNEVICLKNGGISKGIWSYSNGVSEISIELMGASVKYEIIELQAVKLILRDKGTAEQVEFKNANSNI